ncbi:hypothetical protein NO2_1048 [Candidatus Termititenax persephonae]|uniref:Uncharacterized protein n=1 Tax=Candidatus Termititenax persephonae TaxID=2218525 RepID=A0A388TH91_9BACT|nr:hypothetical protein NO2_1048 [Candidatus Termititenax persephonae]
MVYLNPNANPNVSTIYSALADANAKLGGKGYLYSQRRYGGDGYGNESGNKEFVPSGGFPTDTVNPLNPAQIILAEFDVLGSAQELATAPEKISDYTVNEQVLIIAELLQNNPAVFLQVFPYADSVAARAYIAEIPELLPYANESLALELLGENNDYAQCFDAGDPVQNAQLGKLLVFAEDNLATAVLQKYPERLDSVKVYIDDQLYNHKKNYLTEAGKTVILGLLAKNGAYYKFISGDLQKDAEVILTALRNYKKLTDALNRADMYNDFVDYIRPINRDALENALSIMADE